MKLLLHICCGPCSIYPIRVLGEDRFEVMGYFYRSNIHPYTECLKRQETLESYARQIEIKLIIAPEYDLEGFLRSAVFRESNRCELCYHDRLRSTALIAKRGKFDTFSTTLLYSKFQKHEAIRSIGEAVGKEVGIPFHYQDFPRRMERGYPSVQSGWACTANSTGGCIYSEKERYLGRASKTIVQICNHRRPQGSDKQFKTVTHPCLHISSFLSLP